MSAHPQPRSDSTARRAKVTIAELAKMKASSEPITVLTAYDYPTSLLSEQAEVDVVLVGDSLSQVALGYEDTTSITLDEMIHHCRAVSRGAKTPFLIADLPFGSFEVSVEQGVQSSLRMIKEGGINCVKIEGGREILPLVEKLASVGIPVMPHVGLQPQRATSTSGYLVQGRSSSAAIELLETVKDFGKAGATMILIEAVPHQLATAITKAVDIPTIGIGAGPGTSGQVLVITDVLGTYAQDIEWAAKAENADQASSAAPAIPAVPPGVKSPGQPKFVRQFGTVGQASRYAVNAYVRAVKDGSFPAIGKETYTMKKDEAERFEELVRASRGDSAESSS